MGWTVGLEPSRVRHSGHVRDVPGLPGTLGWDRQCSPQWDSWKRPGYPWASWNLDSGIGAI